MKILEIETRSKVDFQEVTQEIQRAVESDGVGTGLCQVFVPHTTAGIIVNEHADPSVVQDITEYLDKLVPQRAEYRHMEGNSPAHIKASLVGNSLTLIINNGKIVLGTWQGVFLCEFDGPRRRRIAVNIIES
ncbi:secondary thiamine-phosphate synthase enzyme YjbQ [Chloroflexota bacterium]